MNDVRRYERKKYPRQLMFKKNEAMSRIEKMSILEKVCHKVVIKRNHFKMICH